MARLGKRARPSGGAVALAAALRLRRSRACDVKVHMLRYKDTGRSPRCHGRVINVRNRRRRRVRRIGRVKGASAERCKAVTVEVYPFVPSCRPAIIVDLYFYLTQKDVLSTQVKEQASDDCGPASLSLRATGARCLRHRATGRQKTSATGSMRFHVQRWLAG